MRPDATSPFPSPFSAIPEAEWFCANDLAFAIFDSFPVSPGHVLVITRRVVPTFFECTAAEQQALMTLVGEVKALLDQRLEPTTTMPPDESAIRQAFGWNDAGEPGSRSSSTSRASNAAPARSIHPTSCRRASGDVMPR